MKVPVLALLPLVCVAGLAGLFAGGMFREDPDVLPSAQEGRPAPEIVSAPVGDLPTFEKAQLEAPGIKVLNFWASWCAPCRVEHPFIMELAQTLPVYGVNRDASADHAQGFLDELGNPYAGVVSDTRNRQSIEWGVYALPETFFIDGDGIVVLHVRGPITAPVFEHAVKPALAEASAE